LIVALGLLLMTLSAAVAQLASPQLAPTDQSVLHLSETAQRDVPPDLLRAKARSPIPAMRPVSRATRSTLATVSFCYAEAAANIC
jgi:hypothetical protein